MNWDDISDNIAEHLGRVFTLRGQDSIGGGCINAAYRIQGEGEQFFVKFNDADMLDMFEAEADGLHDMAAAKAVRVPEPVCTGTTGHQAYIVMEYLPLGGRAGKDSMRRFGEQLARMHQHTAERFGWHRDNTIGSTPQINTWTEDWVDFWREHRLGYQLSLAGRRGIGSSVLHKGEQLQERMAGLFTDYQPVASVLHGDLWSGNYGISESGEAVIFDPAVYFGDREADLAMTELFGSFGRDFYAAYDAAWPIDAGYKLRKTFYNLYHVINHYNLFGGGYGSQAEGMLDRLLAELR